MARSNFKEQIDRMSGEDDFDPRRQTEVECDYKNHRGDVESAPAIIHVEVDNQCCNGKDKNKYMNLCWQDAIHGYHDEFYCKCEGDDSQLKADDIKFVSEIQEKVSTKNK